MRCYPINNGYLNFAENIVQRTANKRASFYITRISSFLFTSLTTIFIYSSQWLCVLNDKFATHWVISLAYVYIYKCKGIKKGYPVISRLSEMSCWISSCSTISTSSRTALVFYQIYWDILNNIYVSTSIPICINEKICF